MTPVQRVIIPGPLTDSGEDSSRFLEMSFVGRSANGQVRHLSSRARRIIYGFVENVRAAASCEITHWSGRSWPIEDRRSRPYPARLRQTLLPHRWKTKLPRGRALAQ